MAIVLRDAGTEALARRVAALTGESFADVIKVALTERLEREERRRRAGEAELADQPQALGRECAALPDIDVRTPDEIVGYDEAGMW